MSMSAKIVDLVIARLIAAVAVLATVAIFTFVLHKIFSRLYLHPLSAYPGPTAAAATYQYKAFVECVLNKSWSHELVKLHAKYGNVIRIGPDELHFSDPEAYHEIYNNKNRWDKESKLYHSFGEDRSSFGYLTYGEAKERKDVLNKMFSAKAVLEAKGLVLQKIDILCQVFGSLSAAGKPADLHWAFRCLTMDIITSLCFGSTVDALHAPGFFAPIIEAMDASLPVFIRFKHFEWYKNMIVGCPPNISKIISPSTRGLIDLQLMIKSQIQDLAQHPEKLDHLPHKMTVYHQLMNKEAYRTNTVPDEGSLYEETQALMFAGSDTAGNALMVGAFHLLSRPKTYAKFKKELLSVWPDLDVAPSLQTLESLPYLAGVIKESLRLSVGVVSGLPRVVPKEGARISNTSVLSGTIVSCSPMFLHFNPELFPSPQEFRPERWLDNPGLDNWLVSFSRGPRSCLGINLAWMELRLSFAYVFRRFDMELAQGSPDKLEFRDCFLPCFLGPHVLADVTAVKA